MKQKIIFLFLLCNCSLFSQIVISPLPSAITTFNMEDIWRVNIMVSGADKITAALRVVIEDGSHQQILVATARHIRLNSGINNLQILELQGDQIQFGSSTSAATIRQTGSLPFGEYIICYSLHEEISDKRLSDYCYEKSVTPMLPPELMQPFNEEEVFTTSPFLVWKGPFPQSSASVRYNLLLVEVKDGQQPAEAIEKNNPLLSRQCRDQTQLMYPADAPDLAAGRTYAWRISAFTGNFHIGTTSVWTFKIKQEKRTIKNDSYRMLSDQPDGNHFITKNGVLRFAYNNRYNADTLQYVITSLSSTTRGKSNFPVINLKPGVNKIDMDLKEGYSLTEGQKYLLQINNQHTNDLYLEFIYHKGD